jgi:hypothetical protein
MEIDTPFFSILHNQEVQNGDERFEIGHDSLLAFQRRIGDVYFIHFVQQLALLAERVKRKYKKKK